MTNLDQQEWMRRGTIRCELEEGESLEAPAILTTRKTYTKTGADFELTLSVASDRAEEIRKAIEAGAGHEFIPED